MTDRPFLSAYGITFRWNSQGNSQGHSQGNPLVSAPGKTGCRDLVLDEVSFDLFAGRFWRCLDPMGPGSPR